MNTLLQQAISHHHAGELEKAEKRYREILQNQPNHPDANHNLGVLLVNLRQPQLGLNFFKIAVENAPHYLQFWLSYLATLIETNQFDIAQRVCENAQQFGLSEENFEVLRSSSKKLFQDQLIKIFESGDYATTETLAKFLTTYFPNGSFYWKILGSSVYRQNRYEEALEYMINAVQLSPEDSQIYNVLILLYGHLKKFEQSVESFKKALLFNPNYPEAFNNFATVLTTNGQFVNAIENCKKAIALKPDYTDAYVNLGNALLKLGHFEESEIAFRNALLLNPNHPDVHSAGLALLLLLLLLGKLSEGFAEYQWAYHTKNTNPAKPQKPEFTTIAEWKGESVQNKTILIYFEQGFGDMIHFVRYAEHLKANGATVFVSPKTPLVKIFKTMPFVDLVLENGDQFKADFWTFPLWLPFYFKTELETIPCNVPYLFVDSCESEWWKIWLDKQIPKHHKRIGLVWAGNPNHANDSNRSIDFSELTQLAEIQNVTFVSLQLGEARKAICNDSNFEILDASPWIKNFSDSAALLNNLDLLITVDSAPAHLAGALNLPVWVLVTYIPDWRWLLECSDSPWYPSIKIFRQPKIGDWQSVLLQIRNALTKL